MKKILTTIAIVFLIFSASAQTPSHFAPVNPNATPEARELLERLYKSVDDGKILSGLHYSGSTSDLDRIAEVTGREPVVWGNELAWGADQTVKDVITAYESGHIITLMWHAPRPFDKGPVSFRGHTCGKMTPEQWNELMTEGSDMYNMWLAQIDSIATNFLKPLQEQNIPILWRPYHEMNGEWFWWGWREGPQGYEELYRRMWNRFVNFHHLNNLLWVWNANGPRNIPGDTALEYYKFYPGNDYVDVLATDIYNHDWKQSHHDELIELGKGKLIALGEIGNLPKPEDLVSMNKYAWFMLWNGFTSEKYNSADDIKAVYSYPGTVSFEAKQKN